MGNHFIFIFHKKNIFIIQNMINQFNKDQMDFSLLLVIISNPTMFLNDFCEMLLI